MSRHDLGLAADLEQIARQANSRRQLLHWLGGGAASLALSACGGGNAAAAVSAGASTGSGSCSVFPDETAGPFPGDGSNSNGAGVANALRLSGIVRSDIRSSIAGASGVAGGVPLSVKLRLLDRSAGCAALEGLAIYLWHCDREGRYSMYSSSVTAENYLRGVQATGADGTATFLTSFPGCYPGRMPHIHFEVYRSLSTATQSSNRLKTSQLALPPATCQAAYASSGYAASLAHLARISFASDGVFSDGVGLQLARMSGDNRNGYLATLDVAIPA